MNTNTGKQTPADTIRTIRQVLDDDYWDAMCIPLSKGYHAIIDAADYHLLCQHSWHAGIAGGGNVYARTSVRLNGKRTTRKLHWVLLKMPSGRVIDHINRNSLDNRRKNLRICTRAENNRNSHALTPRGTSRYKGVYWFADRNKWRVAISVDSRIKHVTYSESETEAALAYNEAAKKYHGKFAYLNVIGGVNG